MTKFIGCTGPILENSRKTFEAGNPIGLIEAIPLCIDLQELPQWVTEGLQTALRHYVKTHLTGKSKAKAAFKQRKADLDDFRSYRAVRAAMADGFKGERRWDEAVRLLASNWGIERELSTVVTAHRRVLRALKTEEGRLRYAAFKSPSRPFIDWILR